MIVVRQIIVLARPALRKLNRYPGGGLVLFGIMLLAAQCQGPPTLPLPTPPTGSVIRIALLYPATGELATFGRMLQSGSSMAFDEWNSRGGLLGHRIEWAVYDTDCQFDTARQAVQQALDDGLHFIVGPLCSEAAIAAAGLAEAAQALMISPTATHPLVTVSGQGQTRSTIFRAAFAFPWQGEAAAHFAYETLEARKAALVADPTDDYAASLTDVFARTFEGLGGDIVYQAAPPSSEPDFSGILETIFVSQADIIYLPAMPAEANRFASYLTALRPLASAETSAAPILLGSDRWASGELDLVALAGSYYTTHFVLEDPRPAVQSWREAYKSIYATEPNTLAALGYDAAMILATAIEQAGSFETTLVAQTLAEGNYAGVTGQISFDGSHNPSKPVPVVRIEAGQRKFMRLIEGQPETLNFQFGCSIPVAGNCPTIARVF
ncbi:MAG TPA: ABC transporter substrate-binding protein [Anaerolineae bacterium]|jgi:branched-chain amino acid transport system substrate-binding protein